jgi:hypothetical protein
MDQTKLPTRERKKELARLMETGAAYTHFNLGAGQATVLTLRDGQAVHFAIAFCSPDDNFSRAEGRKHALRAFFGKDGHVLGYGQMPGFYLGQPEDKRNTLEEAMSALRARLSDIAQQPNQVRWLNTDKVRTFRLRGRRRNQENK